MREMISPIPSFEEKKLATTVIACKGSSHPHQLYGEREAVIRFFESFPNSDFEFYGVGWEKKGYKNYRGQTPDKTETIKHYRFYFCYENMHNIEGYITEKIFNCFTAGCVPIYLDASNIQNYIPKNCFIDRRDFKDLAEVYAFIF